MSSVPVLNDKGVRLVASGQLDLKYMEAIRHEVRGKPLCPLQRIQPESLRRKGYELPGMAGVVSPSVAGDCVEVQKNEALLM